jgi:hypothetical protein
MTNTNVSLQPRHIIDIKNIAYKANPFFCVKAVIAGGYPGRILATML